MANNEEDFVKEREAMVKKQLIRRGIEDKLVLDAFREVPREKFVPDHVIGYSYHDGPLPIGKDQTISQPYIVAEMVEALELSKDDIVLEIGTGSGYEAAILSKIAKHVYTVERIQSLADKAKEKLDKLNYKNITIKVGDGSLGWPKGDKVFDGIVVSAGAPSIPASYKKQLKAGGYLVIPVGSRALQNLYKVRKNKNGNLEKQSLGHVRFVPLLGEQAW
ncbi:MAG TPA: protein-L-isoaspartate(D-aspartate) O-methyltransferase [Halanaerobiales bacterium]|nr:protein-L-isoaspartate(D-aspartate) O-methyltransferase [Halanaerobiales bacterium]